MELTTKKYSNSAGPKHHSSHPTLLLLKVPTCCNIIVFVLLFLNSSLLSSHSVVTAFGLGMTTKTTTTSPAARTTSSSLALPSSSFHTTTVPNKVNTKLAEEHNISRRQCFWCITTTTAAAATMQSTRANAAVEELPKPIRKYTALAPLNNNGDRENNEKKQTNLSLQQVASQLTIDLTRGSTNQGPYFLTGDLTPTIFADDCTFTDPTNSVSSLSKYRNALKILFDESDSTVDLISPLVVDEETSTIRGTIQSQGTLKLPWKPRISSYTSDITYVVDRESGLIVEQVQVWSVSASQALRETFTPGGIWNYKYSTLSTRIRSVEEPTSVSELFGLVNGRRVDSYDDAERGRIDALITEIVDSAKTDDANREKQQQWNRNLLPGTWRLVYIQPGSENGGGIDRRIPFFPDLPFNDSFQKFTSDSVLNVGEVLGSSVVVRVFGSLREENENSLDVPKRFVANINGGELCVGAEKMGQQQEQKKGDGGGGLCVPLPISGEGLFDGVYLGERLRIGQNLNGTGARVVQIRIA